MSDEPDSVSRKRDGREIEFFRTMPAWQKLEQVAKLNRVRDQLLLGELRRRHPDATERELFLRLAALKISPDLMKRAFNWDPDDPDL